MCGEDGFGWFGHGATCVQLSAGGDGLRLVRDPAGDGPIEHLPVDATDDEVVAAVVRMYREGEAE